MARTAGFYLLFLVGILYAVPATAHGSGEGREGKFDDSASDAKRGSDQARDAGNQMIATAIPMLASPITPVQIAGADLMAKGITELKQSAASNDTSRKDRGGEQLLTNHTADYSSTGNTLSAAASSRTTPGGPGGSAVTTLDSGPTLPGSLLKPEVAAQLPQAGLNPVEFVAGVNAGVIGSAESVLRTVGISVNPTPEQLAQAAAISGRATDNAITAATAANPMTVRTATTGDRKEEGAAALGTRGEAGASPGGGAGAPDTKSIPMPAGYVSANLQFGRFKTIEGRVPERSAADRSISSRMPGPGPARSGFPERSGHAAEATTDPLPSLPASHIFNVARGVYSDFRGWLRASGTRPSLTSLAGFPELR